MRPADSANVLGEMIVLWANSNLREKLASQVSNCPPNRTGASMEERRIREKIGRERRKMKRLRRKEELSPPNVLLHPPLGIAMQPLGGNELWS